MPHPNVEIVRRTWQAWEQRDMAALFALYHPEIEWDQRQGPGVAAFGDAMIFHGHAGVRRFFRDWLSDFDDYWARPLEFVEVGERVLVRYRQGGRGKASGAEVEMPDAWQVYELREGRVTRITVFADAEPARAYAGR